MSRFGKGVIGAVLVLGTFFSAAIAWLLGRAYAIDEWLRRFSGSYPRRIG